MLSSSALRSLLAVVLFFSDQEAASSLASTSACRWFQLLAVFTRALLSLGFSSSSFSCCCRSILQLNSLWVIQYTYICVHMQLDIDKCIPQARTHTCMRVHTHTHFVFISSSKSVLSVDISFSLASWVFILCQSNARNSISFLPLFLSFFLDQENKFCHKIICGVGEEQEEHAAFFICLEFCR